ncbi:hypothetical protein [Methanobrevibacter sp.]|uniref:hypothetical protein n=1 Tax=Methanobrevibacter sp. TaxID=66852 RepID=UPI003863D5DA
MMDKKMKIILAVVAVIIIAILGVFLFLSNSDVTLSGLDSQVTLPNNYTLDDKGVATLGDVGIYYTGIQGGDTNSVDDFYKALKSNGKDSGYQNITTDKINGFKVYEFAANPKELKNVSSDREYSGNQYSWTEYPPYIPYKGMTDMDVDHFRYIGFINPNTKTLSELTIFTNNSDVNLYSKDIDAIINSIAPIAE